MLWRHEILEAGGGIEALGAEIAEDAAATKLIRAQGLDAHLVSRPFQQPLGKRRLKDVWSRQLRWARLRRATFPLQFLPEVLTTGLLTIGAAAFAAPEFGLSVFVERRLRSGLLVRARSAARRRRRLAAELAKSRGLDRPRRPLARPMGRGLDRPRHRLARQCDERRRNRPRRGDVRTAAADVSACWRQTTSALPYRSQAARLATGFAREGFPFKGVCKTLGRPALGGSARPKPLKLTIGFYWISLEFLVRNETFQGLMERQRRE